MILRCRNCRAAVSGEVAELKDVSKLSEADGQDHLPKGYYRIATAEDDVIIGNGEFILNLKDLINTRRHSNKHRLNGCCGLDGADGMNIVCACGNEIGTECSDCWMPHYAHIPQSEVETV